MAAARIELNLPEELFEQLQQVAEALGIADPAEAAVIGLADWVSRRRSEIEDRDPSQRYFINEALDELSKRGK